MAFSLREFIKKGFLDAAGKMADYQIILNAAGWLEKGVLTEDDLSEIQEAIEKNNTPPAPLTEPETEPVLETETKENGDGDQG